MKKIIDNISEKIVVGFHLYSDIILGVFLTLFSAYMFYETWFIQIKKLAVSPVDTARFFPRLVFGGLVIIGIAMTVLGFRKLPENKETVPTGEKLAASVLGLQRGVVAVVCIGIFILLMESLGFIIAAVIYMVGSMFFMGSKEVWKPVLYVAVAVVVAIACYYLFKKFVYVQLPAGILKGVF